MVWNVEKKLGFFAEIWFRLAWNNSNFITPFSLKLVTEITVQDNGNGIKQENTKENSLGMKLIKLMCLQLKATHTVEKINGVKHHIKFNKV